MGFTELYYVDYSEINGQIIEISVYVKTEDLKYNLGLYHQSNYSEEEFNKKISEMSSDDVKGYIEAHGCYGVFIH